MAIVKAVKSSSNATAPFLQEYFEDLSQSDKANIADSYFEVDVIKAVDSGKGFMVSVYDFFNVFIWKNSSYGKFLKEYINNAEFQLIIQVLPDEKLLKPTFEFCFDDSIPVYLRQDLFHHSTFDIVKGKKPPIAPLKTMVNQNTDLATASANRSTKPKAKE